MSDPNGYKRLFWFPCRRGLEEKQIPTRKLRASDVPRVDPDQLDYSKPTYDQLGELWRFALTFDGYAFLDIPTRRLVALDPSP